MLLIYSEQLVFCGTCMTDIHSLYCLWQSEQARRIVPYTLNILVHKIISNLTSNLVTERQFYFSSHQHSTVKQPYRKLQRVTIISLYVTYLFVQLQLLKTHTFSCTIRQSVIGTDRKYTQHKPEMWQQLEGPELILQYSGRQFSCQSKFQCISNQLLVHLEAQSNIALTDQRLTQRLVYVFNMTSEVK